MKITYPYKLFLCIAIGTLLFSCGKENGNYKISEEDKIEIENFKTQLTLILANEGWEAYENMFTENYKNWSMLSDKVRSKDEFLPLVKQWYDAGNRAIDSEVVSIDFIPIAENKVMYLKIPHSPSAKFLKDYRPAGRLVTIQWENSDSKPGVQNA